MFFSMIESLGGVLMWRAYGKRLLVDKYVAFMKEKKFPPRFYKDEDCLDYLARIEDGNFPLPTQRAAVRFQQQLATNEEMGILVGMRMHSASEAALEKYSPNADAPAWGDHNPNGQS
jgi:hypothetical protein